MRNCGVTDCPDFRIWIGDFGFKEFYLIYDIARAKRYNSAIIDIDKENVFGLVPDYIWENHDNFSMCRHCERFFWAGSHVERSREMIERLFKMKTEA